MRKRTHLHQLMLAVAVAIAAAASAHAQSDPLPSWNDGPNKRAIVDFVMKFLAQSGEVGRRGHEERLENGFPVGIR